MRSSISRRRWTYFTRLALGAAVVAGMAAPIAASAADLGPTPEPVMAPQDDSFAFFGTGWYIRGDLGYSVPQGPSASYNGSPFTSLSVGNSAVLGGGVGYKISNWFRADVTADYNFSSNVRGSYTIPGCCRFTDKTGLDSWSVLANGYADLGTWSGVTPYIGAGIGYAFTEASRVVSQAFVPSGAGPAYVALTSPNGTPVFNVYQAHTTGGVAWALMAGAAVTLAPSVKLDIGYRYLNIADARMAPDIAGIQPKLKSLGAHQFRIGVRFMFDE